MTKSHVTIKLEFDLLIYSILPFPIPDGDQKLTLNFIFTLLCRASKRFMRGLKTS